MKEMTKENLKAAFAGESQAFMKYTIFADKAEKEGYPQIAKLFRAIAYAERVHAENHLRALGGINDTVSNLQTAFSGENFENDEMYPAYYAVAELQEEKSAMRTMKYALEAELIHEKMYIDAKVYAEQKKDMPEADVWVCPVCGHTVIGNVEEDCPVCKVSKSKYVKF